MSFFLSVLADLSLPEEHSSLDDDDEDDDELELESRKADKLLFFFFSFFFISFAPSKSRSPKKLQNCILSLSISLSLSESTILDKAGRQLGTSMSTRPAGAMMFSQRHRLFGVVATML
jgi:hypothetical protein